MTDLRDMELLCALDQHRHFARAASACGISQPAFSARIRNLETDLGIAIVHRGNRFQGFTDEGQIVLQWARRLLDDADALSQALSEARGHLTGELIIGSIPTALPFAADIPAMIRRRHPDLRVQLRSASAQEIRQGIDSRALHAGITYADDHITSGIIRRALYDEHYILLAPEDAAAWPGDSLAWADAAQLPL